jgi:valyl-tRNA synthetase
MKPLAEKALEVVLKDEIKFYPVRWRKTYIDWMENIRDWCISRQIWWGHRIPVWYCGDCGEIIVSETDAKICPKCKSVNLTQESDVLDTWFSSWLWPFTTMGWDGDLNTDDLKKFFPTNVLATAPEILFFWVARMIMASLYFTGKIPFSDVILHGTVRDKSGQKMSKSLGNTIDPLEIIFTHGADSLRFSMIMNTAAGTDVFIGKDSFDIGRNFANKLWNASRFVITNAQDSKSGEDKAEDKWIMSRLNKTIEGMRNALEQYRFNEASHLIYDFIWKDFCDWYIEAKKIDQKREIALYVLNSSLKLLHPFMPFVTEEIWRHLGEKGTIMLAEYPKVDSSKIKDDDDFTFLQEIITGLRTIRSENGVAPNKKVDVVIIPSDKNAQEILSELDYLIKFFVKTDNLTISQSAQKPALAGQNVVRKSEIYVVLEGLVDIEAEKEKVVKEIARLENAAKSFENRLNNREFTDKAPPKVIENEKAKYANVLETLEKLKVNLASFG